MGENQENKKKYCTIEIALPKNLEDIFEKTENQIKKEFEEINYDAKEIEIKAEARTRVTEDLVHFVLNKFCEKGFPLNPKIAVNIFKNCSNFLIKQLEKINGLVYKNKAVGFLLQRTKEEFDYYVPISRNAWLYIS